MGLAPKMKLSRLLFLTEVFMALLLFLYMTKFPVFPEVRSADFAQHAAVSRDLSRGIFPPLSGQVLYYGIEYYLAGWQLLFPGGNPIFTVRWAMAFLVLFSPLLVYRFVREIFDDVWVAKVTAFVYAVSGFIWMDMVMVTGLYANFYGVLSSLGLLATTLRYQRRGTERDFIFLAAAFVNAAFSHYSTLLLLVPLVVYLAEGALHGSERDRSLKALALFILPSVGILLLFPGLLNGLLGFLAPTANVVPAPTPLSVYLYIPSLQFLAEELTDYGFVFLIFVAAAFSVLAIKKRDLKMILVLFWFLFILLVAPQNSSAWRFSFVAVVPATLMLGWTLAQLPQFPLVPTKRNALFLLLLFMPTFYPSWSFSGLSHSLQQYPEGPQADFQVQDALEWIGKNLPVDPVCANAPQAAGRCSHMVSVTDWRLVYSPLFGGPAVFYAPDYGVDWVDPLQVALFGASHNSTSIIVTNRTTNLLLRCNPGGTLGLRFSMNATGVNTDERVLFRVSAITKLNTSVRVYDNGTYAGNIPLRNGSGSIVIYYSTPGWHTLFVNLGQVNTSPLVLGVGPFPGFFRVPTPDSAGVPPDYCLPWRSFNYASLQGWRLVYFNEDVKIWSAPLKARM